MVSISQLRDQELWICVTSTSTIRVSLTEGHPTEVLHD